MTKLSKVYTATLPFGINPINVDDTYVILNKEDAKLNITIETYGFNWLRYAIKQPELDIDFNTDVIKKDSLLIWSMSRGFPNINKQFSKQKKIISINPDTLVFKYDTNNIKYVPVVINANIQYAQGYNTLDDAKIIPDSIKLIGPSSILKNIKNVTTQQLDLDNIKANVNTVLGLNLDSLSNKVKTNFKQVNLSVKVSKFSEGVVNLPIEIINIPRGKRINYFPKQIAISYSTSLENFNAISANDFKVICNYKDAIDNSFLTPEVVKQPDNVKNVRVLQQKIEFIIKE
ncbi:CdaR family protein [Olleya sp. HaHaR_3_96]|uniref:CdaR family protein n=1 Tax=Olleya sp. HaHaR_3_96 TaxID=2745560 RepID=UPI001C500D51|nr:YbbR-like domain-containing protein [Olleya sp. HaHaR_3_96]QXP58247.1 YbbR-like domain-containing protein [Olleya sp. HaHaR_3_96]